jgi:pimeloyl-ACP methyl ester carboxylesterase
LGPGPPAGHEEAALETGIPPSGYAPINHANIYYEVAGEGAPLVMIHAGVADRRQWENEFASFQRDFLVLRYDLRGYGNSEPVDGEFSHMADLLGLLDYLRFDRPLILMGCSMGGGLAMDFALAHPSRTRALIMVDAGPSGLELDVPKHPKSAEADKAYEEGNLDLAAELETQIWFDGMGRTPTQVDPAARKLVYDMDRRGLALDARHLGKRLPDASVPAAGRLEELKMPVLIIVGAHDLPYMQSAASYMAEKLPRAEKVVVPGAAHLPNLDHPGDFQRIVTSFLDGLPR